MSILIALFLHWLRDNRWDVGKMAFSRQIPQKTAFIPRHVWDHRFVDLQSEPGHPVIPRFAYFTIPSRNSR